MYRLVTTFQLLKEPKAGRTRRIYVIWCDEAVCTHIPILEGFWCCLSRSNRSLSYTTKHTNYGALGKEIQVYWHWESYVLEHNQKLNQDGNLIITRDMIYQKLTELGQRIIDTSSQKSSDKTNMSPQITLCNCFLL